MQDPLEAGGENAAADDREVRSHARPSLEQTRAKTQDKGAFDYVARWSGPFAVGDGEFPQTKKASSAKKAPASEKAPAAKKAPVGGKSPSEPEPRESD